MTRLSSIPPVNDSRRPGSSEPPRATLNSPARKRAMISSVTTIPQLVWQADQNDDLGIGSVVLTMDGNVRYANGLASSILRIPQDPDPGAVTLIDCVDPMRGKSRILRELQEQGIAFQVPTKIHTDLSGTVPSDWLVTIKTHFDLAGNPLAHSMLLIENAETAALAGTDALTGLANRRTFTHEFTREFGAVQRHKGPLSLLYIDVDRFKRFNDEFGHDVGDAVLQAVATCLAQTVRASDLPCRLGGEEFAVVLPRTEADGAYTLAEKLRVAVERCVVEVLGKQFSVTISVGVCTYQLGDNATVDGLISHADRAMLKAKEEGRNRTRVSRATIAA